MKMLKNNVLGSNRKKNKDADSIGRLQMGILFAYTFLMMFALVIFAVIIFRISSAVMKEKVSGLISSNSQQLQININNYLSNIEKTSSLFFVNDEYCNYDATDNSLDEYDQIQVESDILDRIVDLGLMGNYADFTLVYSNDRNVGWLSNVTGDLFPTGEMYNNFAACITNEKTNDGWSFGVGGAQDRMYYVKRINNNTILLSSFYSKELDSLFDISDEFEGVTVRLVSQDNRILYSSDRNEIGEKLGSEIVEITGNRTKDTIIKNDYIVDVTTCENDWRLICTVPEGVMLKEINDLRKSIIGIGIAVGLFFVLIGLMLISKFTRPVNGVVDELQQKAMLDQMSGLLNKTSYENSVAEQLSGLDEKEACIFCMIDVDNFKNINDRLGHDYGDEVIVRVSNLLRRRLGAGYTIGRVGGDEFSLYKKVNSTDHARYTVETEMSEFMEAFAKEFKAEYDKCDTSLSVGIVICEGEDNEFDSVYQMADSALYRSKRNGKNTYTVYGEA